MAGLLKRGRGDVETSPVESASSPPAERRLRFSGAVAVWTFTALLGVLALALLLGPVGGYGPLATPHLPWWVVAMGFAAGELCVVHLEFRRSAHSFSLADVPMVLGLLFSSAPQLLAGALVGTGLVYVLHRRLPPIKVAFNLAQLAVATALAVLILHGVVAEAGIGPQAWAGVYLATFTAGILTIVFIAAAMSLSEGMIHAPTLRQMLGMDALVTITNTSLALAMAVVLAHDPRALPLLAVPAVTVFAVYRAYLTERQRHEKLEFLYEANRTLARSPEIAEALEGLLLRSLEAFRCEIAEIVLFGDGRPLRTRLGPKEERRVLEEVEPDLVDGLRGLVDDASPVTIVDRGSGSPALRAHLAREGVQHGVVAMLRGEEREIGTLMLANRLGLTRTFSPDDLRLLEALANNASVALQYDRLEQAVLQLRELQDRLHHQAFHDPLTDLPNRALLLEAVRTGLSARNEDFAVLFVDVDDFKTVNDSLGHGVGDELLVAVATRLRQCVRPGDLVARMGGDEFGILLRPVADPAAGGLQVAERVMRAFSLPVPVGGQLISVHVSVGIATSAENDEGEEGMLRNAEDGGQGALRAVRAGDGGRDRAAARAEGGAATRGRRPRPRGPLPVDRVAGDRRAGGRGGARALDAHGARPRRARGVHPACGGDGADPPHRALRARRGVPAARRRARRRRRAVPRARQRVGGRAARSRAGGERGARARDHGAAAAAARAGDDREPAAREPRRERRAISAAA